MNPTERLLNLVALFLAAPAPVSLAELKRLFYPDSTGGDMSARRLFTRDKAWLSELGFPLVHHRLSRSDEASDAAEGYRLADGTSALDPTVLPQRQRRHLMDCAFRAMLHPALTADAALLHAAWLKLSLAESDVMDAAEGKLQGRGRIGRARGGRRPPGALMKGKETPRDSRPFQRLPPTGFSESLARGWTGAKGALAKRFRQVRRAAVRGFSLAITYRLQGENAGTETLTGIVQDGFLDREGRLWLRIGAHATCGKAALVEPSQILAVCAPGREADPPSSRLDHVYRSTPEASNEDRESPHVEGLCGPHPPFPVSDRLPAGAARGGHDARSSWKRDASSASWLSWQAILQSAGPGRLGDLQPTLPDPGPAPVADVRREVLRRASDALAAHGQSGAAGAPLPSDASRKRSSTRRASSGTKPSHAHGAERRKANAAANDS